MYSVCTQSPYALVIHPFVYKRERDYSYNLNCSRVVHLMALFLILEEVQDKDLTNLTPKGRYNR